MPVARLRSLIGTLALIVGMTVYALVVMRVGVALPNEGWLGRAAQPVFYLVTGLIWLYPAARVVRWTVRPALTARPPAGTPPRKTDGR